MNPRFLSLPSGQAGLSSATNTTAWSSTSWTQVTPSLAAGMHICAVQYQLGFNGPGADATREMIMEIATGASGSETTIVQLPLSVRPDTTTYAHVMPPQTVYLPEPVTVAAGTRIAVRARDGFTTAVTYNGIKLLCTDDSPSVALDSPSDTATVADTTPSLAFTGTDTEGTPIEYGVQVLDGPVPSIAYVNGTTIPGGANGNTSGAIDTTGADFLVVTVGSGAGGPKVITDSKSNQWTQLTEYAETYAAANIFYCVPTSVGTGHTFTISGTNSYSSGVVQAFSGVHQTAPYDKQNGANTTGSGTLQTGSVTPAAYGSLIIAGVGFNTAGTPLSINFGFVKTNEVDFASGTNYGTGGAYMVQEDATAINPTWTRQGSSGMAAIIAVFKPASAVVISASSTTDLAAFGVSGSSTKRLENQSGDGWSAFANSMYNGMGQSFTVGAAGMKLTLARHISQWPWGYGPPTTPMTIWCKLYTPSGSFDLPNTLLATSATTYSTNDIRRADGGQSPNYTMMDFVFDQLLAPNTKYVFVVGVDGTIGAETYLTSLTNSTSSYSGGMMCRALTAGGYQSSSSTETWFEIWGSDGGLFNSGSQVTYTCTELAAGTYYWRARGKDTAGSGLYGSWPTARSMTVVAPPSLTTSACTGITATSATGNGNVTATGGATVTRRGFCFMAGTSGDPTTSDSVVYDDGTFSTGTFNKSLGTLTTEGSYRVRAYAVNTYGTGYGTTVQLSLDQPPTVSLSSPSDTALVTDSTPDLVFTGTDSGGDEIEYEVQLDTSSGFDSTADNNLELTTNGTIYKSPTTTTATDDISFFCWVKIHDQTAAHSIFMNGLTGGGGRGFGLYVDDDAGGNVIGIDVAYVADIRSNLAITDSNWHFVGMTRSSSDSKWMIYLDGASYEGGTNSPFGFDASCKFIVGGVNVDGTVTAEFHGEIARVGYWERVLTGTEMQNLYSGYTVQQISTTSLIVDLPCNDDAAWGTNGGSGGTFSTSGTLTEVADGFDLFAGPILTKLSSVPDATFTDITDGGDTHPFGSGDQIRYTVQAGDALTPGVYYWRVRGIDPSGSNTFGSWATTRSFTVIDSALDQAAAAFYEDGTESGSVIISNGSSTIMRNVASDSTILVRFRLQENNDEAGASTDDYQLQYSLNSGAYVDVDGTPGAGVTGFSSANLTDGGATTNRLGSGTVLSFVGAASAQADTVTLPTHQAGDLLLHFAYREGSTTCPSIPSGWTSVGLNTGTSASTTVAYRIAQSGSESNGTWTNANAVAVHVYRGASLTATDPVVNSGAQAGTGTTVNYSGIATMTDSGVSWVARFAGHSGIDTSLETPPSGHVLRTNSTPSSSEVAGFDSNGPAASSSFGQVSVGGTNDNWITKTLEVLSRKFVPGKISEDGLIDNVAITLGDHTELLYSLTLVAAELSQGDTVDLRVLRNGVILNGYTVTPRITVTKTDSSVKKISSVSQANLKKVSGVAIASVKKAAGTQNT